MRKLMAMATLVMGSSAGCLKNTYTTGQPMGGAIHTIKASYSMMGVVGDATVDLDELCPGGVAWFQSRVEPVDLIITIVTLTISSPVTIEVRCASGQAWMAVPDVEQDMTWIYALDEAGAVVSADQTHALEAM